MKKIIFVSIAVAALALASCKENEGTATASYPIAVCQVAVNTATNSAPVVSSSLYKFDFDTMNRTVVISGDVMTESNNSLSITTAGLDYDAGMFNFDGNPYHEVINIDAFKAGTVNSEPIYNFNCQLTTMAYYPPAVEGIENKYLYSFPYQGRYCVMQYEIGADKRVTTFWPDMTFKGKTSVSYPAQDGTVKQEENETMIFRVFMNVKESKASVIIYNAPFGDSTASAGSSNMVLKDLPLAFNVAGYEISATNVVPEVYEAGSVVSQPGLSFDSFNLTSNGDFVKGSVTFDLAGGYHGEFSGDYLLKLKVEK